MAKFFKGIGAASFLLGIVTFLYFLLVDISPWCILVLVSAVVQGLAFIAIGDLMERVDFLMRHTDITELENKQEHERIQQITCTHCQKEYDMDYPHCPYCGSENLLL